MSRLGIVAAIVGLVVGVAVGYLWWGVPFQRSRQETSALEGQRAAAEVAREQLKAAESKLKSTEDELRMEKDRRARLELMLSQGRK